MDPFPAFDYRQQRPMPDPEPSFSTPSRPPAIWRWWSTLTGPQADAFGTSIAAQEKLRRARLISAILVLASLRSGCFSPVRSPFTASGRRSSSWQEAA